MSVLPGNGALGSSGAGCGRSTGWSTRPRPSPPATSPNGSTWPAPRARSAGSGAPLTACSTGSPRRWPREAVAEAVGVSADELRGALGDGQSIAEVAEANGTDPQGVIDALVASGTERLDAAVADGWIDQATADERKETLIGRAADLVNGELDCDLRRHPARPVALRTIADTIGISTDDLRGALHDGQTIVQAAEAKRTHPQDVIDALTLRATQRITEVANGDTVRQRC